MFDLLSHAYPWLKALHLISMVAWMAGLFYLPRLFVYHAERVERGGPTDELFQTMERKLLRVIMNPAMIATWIFGLLLVLTPGVVDWSQSWPWFKAAGVLAMTWFHYWCGLRQSDFAKGVIARDGKYFRIMNEVPTLLLVVIVVSVVVRPL